MIGNVLSFIQIAFSMKVKDSIINTKANIALPPHLADPPTAKINQSDLSYEPGQRKSFDVCWLSGGP
jgi:hypothetical protein